MTRSALQDDTRQLPARPRCVTSPETTRARAMNGGGCDFSGGGGGGAAVVSLAVRPSAGAPVPHLHRRRHARRPLQREPVQGAARYIPGLAFFCVRLRHGVHRAGRDRELFWPGAARQHGDSILRRRRDHHRDGRALPRFPQDTAALSREARNGRKADGVARRLCNGPRLRLRLDALHRSRSSRRSSPSPARKRRSGVARSC